MDSKCFNQQVNQSQQKQDQCQVYYFISAKTPFHCLKLAPQISTSAADQSI